MVFAHIKRPTFYLMDKIFDRQSAHFIEAIKKYTTNEITYEELKQSHLEYEMSKFPNTDHMRDFIFKFKLDQYKKAMELQRKIRTAKEMITTEKSVNTTSRRNEMNAINESVDMDERKNETGGVSEEKLNELLMRGMYLGWAKKNECGQSLPAYPMLNMLSLGEEKEEDVLEEQAEEYLFEF